MARTCKPTFEEILVSVVDDNVQALAYKALAASSLADAYPEDESFFRRIEIRAMQQLDCIPHDRWQRPLVPQKTVAPALSAPSIR